MLDPTLLGDVQTGAEPMSDDQEMQEMRRTSGSSLKKGTGGVSQKKHAGGFDGADDDMDSDSSTVVEVGDRDGDVEMKGG